MQMGPTWSQVSIKWPNAIAHGVGEFDFNFYVF